MIRNSQRFITAAAALWLFIFGQSSLAATSSNWGQQNKPKYDDSSARQSLKSVDRPHGTVTPFAPGTHNLSLDLGQVFLMGDLGRYSDNIGSQLHYTYGVSEIFAFDSSLGYSEHSDGKYSLTTLLTGLRVNLSWFDKVIPHAVFGLGFYRPSYTTLFNGSPASMASILFGVHLGPGIELQISQNVFFGTSLTFHNMFGATKSWPNGTPLTMGGTYSSFLLHAGVTF